MLIDQVDLQDAKKAYKFPQTSSDILSSGTQQVIDFFLTQNKNKQFSYFQRLFGEFLEEPDKVRTTLINYTRGGYIYKVLNSLIMSKPSVFASEIYNNQLFLKCLFKHAYSKSVASLIQTLLISVQKNESQDENWIQETAQKRVLILEELINSMIQTADNKEL